MEFTSDLQLAYQEIKKARRLLAVGHVSPDADALASLGAMLEAARLIGPAAEAYAEKKPDGSYDFIPYFGAVSAQAPDDLLSFDVILILDCGSISRTGLEARIGAMLAAEKEGRLARRPFIIEFDHHLPQEHYADLEIRLPDKASTTEIIYHFFKANNLEINKTAANCILIGLLTDTGHFLHANSSREAMTVASEMLLRGASLPGIIKHTIRNKSFQALKVWGRVLENMHFNAATGLVSSGLTAEDLAPFIGPDGSGLEADLFGDIVSFLAASSGARVALLLREEGDRVKGSLRSNCDDVDLAAVAQNWGGGGHKKAAGFSLNGRLVRTENGWKVANN